MNDKQYRAAIDQLRDQLGAIAHKQSVGVVVPACMEIVLNSILSIGEREEAMRATQSLRPMIDYIESQIQGTH